MTTEQLLRFWDVGQRRLLREERARLAGLFGAFVDALRWVVVPLWARKAPRQRAPWYLEPEPGERDTTRLTIAELARDLGVLPAGLRVVRGEFEFRKDEAAS